eukprot:COSAG02_NODE_9943_length_2068_cov_9.540378_2_plen_128_part_00
MLHEWYAVLVCSTGAGYRLLYTVPFANPYTLSPGTEAQHICTVTNLPAGSVEDGCAAHGLFWSEYLSKFVVTLGCDQARTPVFKLATSDDLIHWSSASELLTMKQAKTLQARRRGRAASIGRIRRGW